MPEVLWSRSLEGARPGVLLGSDRILMHYETGPGTTLTGFDFAGHELWSRVGLRGHESLPDDRFLVSTADGQPLIIDGSGVVVRRWPTGGIEQFMRYGELIVLADGGHVLGTDLELNQLWKLPWPTGSRPNIECKVNERFYWASGGELRFCTTDGTSGTHAVLPESLIAETRERFVRESGNDWLATVDLPYFWRVSFDRERGRFILANALPPHLVMCLNTSGQPEWCACLSPACCGGCPQRMSDGRYVASSGCGGVLSWLNEGGDILFQSRPHPGVGLATIYSSDVWVLPGGLVVTQGGPGVVAYDSLGRLAWKLDHCYSQFQYEPRTDILVGCFWWHDTQAVKDKVTLEYLTGLTTAPPE